MRIERTFAGRYGEVLDIYNQSTGNWLGWAKPVRGIMTLQSTGAPLSKEERVNLATSAGRAAGERVVV